MSPSSTRLKIRLKRDFNTYPNSVEGRRQGEWILMDYVDFIVHVFSRRSLMPSTVSSVCSSHHHHLRRRPQRRAQVRHRQHSRHPPQEEARPASPKAPAKKAAKKSAKPVEAPRAQEGRSEGPKSKAA